MSLSTSGREGVLKAKINEIICDLSGLEDDDLVGDTTFMELGFDSLFMTQLSGAFQKSFSIKITFRQLMRELSTVVKLAEYLHLQLPESAFQSGAEPVQNTVEDDVVPAEAPESNMDIINMMSNMGGLSAVNANISPSPVSGSVQSVLVEQLKLMSLQLSMMQGGSTVAANALVPPEGVDVKVARDKGDKQAVVVKETTEGIKLPPGFGPQVDEESLSKSLGDKQKYVDELIAAYSQKTAKSKASTQKYRAYHADPRTAAGFNLLWKEMVYPINIANSKGSRLWDIDGNEYIDLLNGFGPNFLGHAPDYVQQALHEQVDKGFELGPQTPLAGEVAQLICEMTGLDRATFVNTGSEAVQAVIRVARTVTGKDKIIVFDKDYHGNFDEVLVRGANSRGKVRTLPLAPGIPRNSVDNVLVLEYGEEQSLEIIEQKADQIAAVLIEPVQSRRPEFRPKEFLQKLRQLTADKNIVFVFDEVITGFRTGLGGAQEYYGVKADLATYGKVLGGGMPIGVVAGKAEFMNTFDGGIWQYGDDSFPESGVTFFAGTFLRHPLAIAASYASLNFLKSQGADLYRNVYQKTSRLAITLNCLFQNSGIGIHVAHFSSQMFFRIEDDNELIELLFYHARLRGLYMLEGFPSYMTLSHTDKDVDQVIQIFSDSIDALDKGGIISIPEARKIDSLPLTAAQVDVWIASQLSDASSCAYNESDTVKLQGVLERDRLTLAVQLVLSRHQSLNLRIDSEGQKQTVDWSLQHNVEFIDLTRFSDAGKGEKLDAFFEDQATTPFDLENGPLVKIHLLKLAETAHLLVIYGHHIAFDGWSSSIVLHEIGQVYSALMEQRDLKLPQPMGFSQYAQEEALVSTGELSKEDLAYWQAQYPDNVPMHSLPLDIKRGDRRNFEGMTLHHEYSPELLQAIRKSSADCGITVHNFLLAGFAIFLHHKSNDPELVIGIPTAGQMHASNDCLVGYCVNLLPLKQAVDKQQLLKNLLLMVRDNVLDAFEHQRCNFSELLTKLPVSRKPGHSPLIELVFNYSSYFSELEYAGLETSVYENQRRAVVFDMFLNIVEMEESLHVDWDFSTELFSLDTMESWVEELGLIYKGIVENPELNVQQLIETLSGQV